MRRREVGPLQQHLSCWNILAAYRIARGKSNGPPAFAGLRPWAQAGPEARPGMRLHPGSLAGSRQSRSARAQAAACANIMQASPTAVERGTMPWSMANPVK